jgi:hypothetical protein
MGVQEVQAFKLQASGVRCWRAWGEVGKNSFGGLSTRDRVSLSARPKLAHIDRDHRKELLFIPDNRLGQPHNDTQSKIIRLSEYSEKDAFFVVFSL